MGEKSFQWAYIVSGMHDYDKTCGGVVQDDEHMELTTNNIF